jgi:uncharacterized protein with HEPN domain
MKRGRTYVDYLRDILDSIEKAQQFTAGMNFDQFRDDDRTKYAVVRALEIIGEASTKIPDAIKGQNPNLPWRQIVGIRNKLVHEYFGLNIRVIWNTVKEDLPVLKPAIMSMLEEASKGGEDSP